MGYYVDTGEQSIIIKKDQFDNCYKAMCELNSQNDLKRGGCWRPNGDEVKTKHEKWDEDKWFSWLPWNYPETCKDFIAILHEIGFENLNYDEEGNLIGFYYSNKTGQEDLFFIAIAPYITKDSYINWRGEGGEMWQWYFDGEKMITKNAVINYE